MDEDLYCVECGSTALAYIETNAECDVYECHLCGTEQQVATQAERKEK
jgi:hypothetical protein